MAINSGIGNCWNIVYVVAIIDTFPFLLISYHFFLVIGGYVSKIMGKKEQTNKAYIISRLLWVPVV